MSLKVRIVTVAGNYDLDCPPDFSFGVFMTTIRANGYFMTPDIYQPLDHILTVFTYDPENMDAMPLKTPNMVGPGTLQ